MGYGDGTFWRDERGLYHFRISVEGKNYHRCAATKLLSQAKDRAKDLRGELLAAAAKVGGPTTLADLKKLIIADYEMRRRKSLPTGGKAWKPLASFFGERATIDDVRRALKNYWPHRAAAGKAPATIRKELAVLKPGTSRANTTMRSHSQGFRASRYQMREPDTLRRARSLRRLQRAWRDPLPLLFAFMYLTGWRLSEVLGLTWRNVKSDQVWLEDSKNGKPRVFPF